MEQHPTYSRLESIDSLRGFALAGIFITHMLEQYIAAPRVESLWTISPSALDKTIQFVGFFLFTGKFFSIFSLLFGISFAIMMDRAAQKGSDFGGRFTWRLGILLVIGIIHSLFYRGDILATYALIGLTLPLFYRVSTPWLIGISLALFFGIPRYLIFLTTGKITFLDYANSPDDPVVHHYLEVLLNGSLLDVISENVTAGFLAKYDFQFAIFGRGYTTLGFFLLGIILIRIRFFQDLDAHKKKLIRTIWGSLISAILMGVAIAFYFQALPKPFNMSSWPFILGITMYDIANICLTIFIISSFLRLYTGLGKNLLNTFSPLGKLALTMYLSQSLFGVIFFYGFGFGFLGKLHDWQTLLIAALLIPIQIQLAKVWLNRFHFGPLEWAWRSATHFSSFPLKKRA